MSAYRTTFTTGGGMLIVKVDREQAGTEVARFSWVAEDTEGALGELAAALVAMERLESRRQRCRVETPRAHGRRRPRAAVSEVSMLDGIDQAIELLELRAVAP